MILKNAKTIILAAVLIGAIGPWVTDTIYTTSVVYLSVIVFIGFLAEKLGLIFFISYLISDFFQLGFHYDSTISVFYFLIGNTSKYLLLYILISSLPKLARIFGERSKIKKIGISSVLVFVWCQSAIVLVRAVYLWAYDTDPSVEAIKSVQSYFYFPMIMAGISGYVETQLSWGKEFDQMMLPKWTWVNLSEVLSRPLPKFIGRTGFFWVFFCGMYSYWLDGVLSLLIIILCESGFFEMYISSFRKKITLFENRSPVFRFITGLITSYCLSYLILNIYPSNDTFRPILFSTLLSVCFFNILFPRSDYLLKKKS